MRGALVMLCSPSVTHVARKKGKGLQEGNKSLGERTAAKLDETLLCKSAEQSLAIAQKMLSGKKASHLDWAKIDAFETKRKRCKLVGETSPGPGHYNIQQAEIEAKKRCGNGLLRWTGPPELTKRQVQDRTEGKDIRRDYIVPSCFDKYKTKAQPTRALYQK